MLHSFTIWFNKISEDHTELVAYRENREPIKENFQPPYSESELRAILLLLEFWNRQDPSQYFDRFEKELSILAETKDKFEDFPYLHNGNFTEHLIERVGCQLYRALFSGEIGREFENRYENILKDSDKTSSLNLIFQLDPDDPASSRYPWELLRKAMKAPLLIQKKVSLIRHVITGEPSPEFNITKPARILFVAPRPAKILSSTTRDQEFINLNTVQQVQCSPTFNGFLKALNTKLPPDIVHFDGHGVFGRFCPKCKKQDRSTFVEWFLDKCQETDCSEDLSNIPKEGFLLFEDSSGNANYIPASSIGNRIAGCGIKLFFLNACQSATIREESVFTSVAPKLVNSGIPAVVAMQFSVSAQKNAEFSKEFYKLLMDSYPIEQAMTSARRLLPEEESFRSVLFLRTSSSYVPGYKHDIIFSYETGGAQSSLENPKEIASFIKNDIDERIFHEKGQHLSWLVCDKFTSHQIIQEICESAIIILVLSRSYIQSIKKSVGEKNFSTELQKCIKNGTKIFFLETNDIGGSTFDLPGIMPYSPWKNKESNDRLDDDARDAKIHPYSPWENNESNDRVEYFNTLAEIDKEIATALQDLKEGADRKKQMQLQKKESNNNMRGTTVFINNHPVDESLALDLAQRLQEEFNMGHFYFPAYSSNSKFSENMNWFETHVLECDGLLVIYGKTPLEWVGSRLNQISKFLSKREEPKAYAISKREEPKAYAIYIGPPDDKNSKIPTKFPGFTIDCQKCPGINQKCQDSEVCERAFLTFIDRLKENINNE